MSTLQVSLYRYNPETDSAPYMEEFQVDTQGRDLMVLDVLHLVKEQDNGLAYRRSCREGVCGSDGMNMNGKNGLACITPLSEVVKKGKLTLRPLPGLPVIRDLVVDMGLLTSASSRTCRTTPRRRPSNACSRLRIVTSSTVSTSASCAPAARPPARRSGGTRTSSSVRPACCRPTASWPTPATRPPASAWKTSRTRSACSAAAAS